MTLRGASLFVGTALAAVLCAPAAFAAADSAAAPAAKSGSDSSELSEVVVTASRMGAQSLQHTAIAVSAFTPDQLEKSQVSNIKDLVEMTPNLQVSQATTNAEIFIRGIGSSNVFAGSDPDVTMQVDGIYYARPSSQLTDFLDVARVEVLRGPQGTLYGRNAVGGTLNVISRQPSDTLEGKVAVTGGDYGLFQGQAYVSGALIPGKVQASLSATYLRHDGYIKNLAPNSNDIDDANRGSVRGQIRVEFTDKLDATTRADFFRVDENFESYTNNLAAIVNPAAKVALANSTVGNYREVAINDPQETHNHGGGISEDINYQLSDHISLKSLTAYREEKYNLGNDSDDTESSLAVASQRENQHQFSQEFTLTAHLDKLDFVTGLYYLKEHINSQLQNLAPLANSISRTQPTVEDESKAIYFQATYHLTDQLNLTVGDRYTDEHKSMALIATALNATTGAITGTPFTPNVGDKFQASTPKGEIDWTPTENVMAYFSVTRGFKSGGFNYAAKVVPALEFGPEKLTSYEGGVKSDWLSHRLRLNLTAFRYDYTGLQVQAFLGPGVSTITNAANATIKGLEFESMAKPFPGLTLAANLSYLDATYGSFPQYSVPVGYRSYLAGNPLYTPSALTFNAAGNELNAAPKYSSFVSATYEHDVSFGGSAYVKGEWSWQDRIYYDPTNLPISSQPAYSLLNAYLGYKSASGLWTAQLFVKNASDKEYLIGVAALGAVPAGHAGPPRTVGVTLTRSW